MRLPRGPMGAQALSGDGADLPVGHRRTDGREGEVHPQALLE